MDHVINYIDRYAGARNFPPSRQLRLWLWLLPLDAPSPNSGGLHSHHYA